MSLPGRVSLVHGLPPRMEGQTRPGACTAHAVVALLEYLTDCRTRLSVSFLFAAMRIKVREWLEGNISAVLRGEKGDADFEHVFESNLAGLRCVLVENEPGSMAALRYVEMFRDRAAETFARDRGCPILFASEALQEYGICRHVFWPDGEGQSAVTFAGDVSALPADACADARRRRLANGLDFLPEPGNVEAVKAVLAGANGNRRMPVVLALGAEAGHDAHSVLAVGYRDDASRPGGGCFLVLDGSGSRRPALLPYAAVAEHCTEAATVIQSMADYAGDGYGGFKMRRRVRLAVCAAAAAAAVVAGACGWHAWRTSPAVRDAPFAWLTNQTVEMERISVAGDVTYGSYIRKPDAIKHHFFRPEQADRVDAIISSNGVAAAVSRRPDILMLFARSSFQACSQADKEAMERYLSEGGTVLALVCDCNRTLMADFLAPYGVKIQRLPGMQPLKAVAPMLRETQLDGSSLFRVTEMTDDWHAMIVTDDAAKSPVMAFRRVGHGKLFCASQQLIGRFDENRFKNVEWWGNLIFACASDSCLDHSHNDSTSS